MLTCRLLGPVEVWFDGHRVDLGYPRQRALLAILLMDVNQLVTVDTLIDRTWGDHPPATARDTLYGDVSKLRRALAHVPGLRLSRRTGSYRIETDPQAIDLQRFRALAARAGTSDDDEETAALLDEVVALWRGEPFADASTPWLDTVRLALNRQRHAAILDRNDAHLRLGRHRHLLTDLSTMSAADPVDERLAGQFVLALYRSGRCADALAHFHHTRQRLRDGLGADPGPELRLLHERILRDDSGLRAAAPEALPGRARTPRQLPAHAPHVIGRTAELRRLTELLDPTDATGMVMIAALGGAGGIGKTWLALRWAHQNADRFPDGQLFVDLRGFTPTGEPMTPQTAMRGFLDGLGVDPHCIPADLDAQAALYRSLVAGRRMLIVLDNAADTAQITPLLPGSPTCTVIVTSRRYLPSLVTAHHAHPVPLGVLSDTEARHLLATRLGADRVAAEPDAVATLLACCAGYPLALGVVIGRALSYPDFPLSVLAAELADTPSALDAMGALDAGEAAASVPGVLSWSVRALPGEQARVFALLGIAPGPDISLATAAVLADLPEGQVRVVLRELEHASLVQQHQPGRYRMHDLIRRYATDTAHRDLTQDVREAALRRVLDFYTRTAHTATRLLDPHRSPIQLDPPVCGVHRSPLLDVPTALAWLDSEYLVLLAAQHVAAGHAWRTTVWQLAWTLETFQSRRGHRHDRIAVWQAALNATAHLPDPSVAIYTHRLLGYSYADLGRFEDGIEYLHQALALATQHHDLDQQARTHRALASAWARRGDDRHALDHALRSLDLYRTLGKPVWQADALNHVGWYAARLGLYDTARTHCETALTLHQHHHNPGGEASTLDSLGFIAHRTGEHRQAISLYQQALAVLQAIGDSSEAAHTLDRLGHPHVALEEPIQARVVWREALELYQEQGRDTDAERIQQQLDTLDQRLNAPDLDQPCRVPDGAS